MTARVFAVVAALLAFALWLARGASVTAPAATPAAARGVERPPDPRVAPTPAPPHVARDPFRYAEEPLRPVVRQAVPAVPIVESPRPAPSPQSPVRLVGFVRRGGQLRAVLSVRGVTSVAGAGEDADGYHVVAVEEDSVRLRAPSGEELSLKPAIR